MGNEFFEYGKRVKSDEYREEIMDGIERGLLAVTRVSMF
jgi:hypothetical protein